MIGPVEIGLVASKTSPIVGCEKYSWADLCKKLTAHSVGPKDGSGWTPAPFKPGPRREAFSPGWSVLAFDIEGRAQKADDGLKKLTGFAAPPVKEMRRELEALGWAGCVSTSSSHMADGLGPRYRVVIPASRLIKRAEIKPIGMLVAARLGMGEWVDDSCLDASRLFYWPRVMRDRISLAEHVTCEGNFIDVDALLSEVRAIKQKLPSEPVAPQERSVIEAFNLRHDIGELLERHGYKAAGESRWISPSSTSGLPGIVRLPKSDKVYSHHGIDVLSTGHAHDAFSAFCQLEHSGSIVKAVGAAARELGMNSRATSPGERIDPDTGEIITKARKEPREAAGAFDGVVTLVRATEVRLEPVKWLWEGYVPLGHVSLLAGDAGTGKTTIAANIAAVISVGGRWPDGTRCTEPGDVIFWSGEDPHSILAARFIANGGDPNRLHFVGSVESEGKALSFDPARDVLALMVAISKLPAAKLLVIDPIVSAVSGDAHKSNDVRRDLQALVDLTHDRGIAVIGITHFSKGTGGREPIQRVTGSLAFAALARVVLIAAKDKTPEDGAESSRLFMRAKSNVGPDDGGFRYQLDRRAIEGSLGVEGQCVMWGDAIQGTARDALAEAERVDEDEFGDKSAVSDAEEFLLEVLSAGARTALEVSRQAKDAGVSQAAVRRAKASLGVKSLKLVSGWVWALKNQDAHQGAHTNKLSTLSVLNTLPQKEAIKLIQDAQGVQDEQGAQLFGSRGSLSTLSDSVVI